ncbi:Dopey domain containing protein [Entamoeba marina]
MRESHYFGFEINDSLIEKHLQILDTLVCCSNSKLIDSLESTSIPRSLLNLYKELNVQNYVQNLDAPTNLLSLIFHTLILYVKKVSILVKQTSTYSFSFQSLGVNVLLHLSTFYGEMSSIQQICVSMQYPILIVFAESISACPKLQLHLISLVKQIMKISDVTEPTQCITRYSLFLQTCISGLCQEKYVYRSLFFTFINDILPLIPISEYKSSVILLMQAVSNVVSQTCNLSSPHILVFASQQIGNAVLFIPLLVVSVFTDEPHFLTASLRQTISSFVDLFLYTTKSNNPFLVQSNCVSFLETLLTVFPHEFIGEYLLLFDVFPDEHATIFRSFRPETTLTILWALIVLSEANVYNDVSPKQINNFIQFFIEKVITPRELYTTQMYIQTLISYHSTNDEMIFSLIHTLKLFLVSISQIEQKYPMKLGNGWQELISSLISKYTTILQRWKLEGLQQRHEKRKSSISQIDFETPKLDDKNVQPTTQPNSSNITSTEINIFTEDIIPIICMTSEESTISTLDLGKTYELLLQQPCADMDMSLAAVNVLIGITKKNQLVGRWNRIVVSAFNENEFFKKPVELLSLWREPISNAFLSNNHRAFLDILYGFAKGILTQGPLFGTKENEAIHRGRLLKRLAFVIYSSEPETFDSIVDQNIPVIEQVMDRIIDTLKTHPHTSVYVNGFLLLRVVLLRCSFTKLRKKIPTVLNELINIFNTPFERDAAIILAGLQVVDMLNIIPESTLDLHTWIFFSPYSPEFTEQSQYFQPLIHGLALNANDGDSTPKQQNWTPNITLQGLEQKRELVITATRLNDMRDYQNLRIELDSYRKELFQVTSRSSELDLNSMNKLLLQSFGEL